MVSSGTVQSDSSTFSKTIGDVSTNLADLADSWRGASFDSLEGQVSNFVTEVGNMIPDQMGHFSSAIDNYAVFLDDKRQYENFESLFYAAQTDEERAFYNGELAKIVAHMQSTESVIHAELAAAASPKFDASPLTGSGASGVAAADDGTTSTDTGADDSSSNNKNGSNIDITGGANVETRTADEGEGTHSGAQFGGASGGGSSGGGGASSGGGGASQTGSGGGASAAGAAGAGAAGGSMASVAQGEHTNDDDFVNYYQTDYPDIPYGHGTIATSGCGPTSLAMVLTALKGEAITPIETAEKGNGTYTSSAGTSWSYFGAMADEYGVSCNQMDPSYNSLVNNLAEGKYMILSMRPGDFTNGGHFIVARGIDANGNIIVADPNSRERSAMVWSPERLVNQCKQMWSFDN